VVAGTDMDLATVKTSFEALVPDYFYLYTKGKRSYAFSLYSDNVTYNNDCHALLTYVVRYIWKFNSHGIICPKVTYKSTFNKRNIVIVRYI
jgi:hypothetical protein